MERKKVKVHLNGKTKINKNTNMMVNGFKTIKKAKEHYLKVILYNMMVYGKMEKKMVMVLLVGVIVEKLYASL
jgi:hypothetical protein